MAPSCIYLQLGVLYLLNFSLMVFIFSTSVKRVRPVSASGLEPSSKALSPASDFAAFLNSTMCADRDLDPILK
jgi:hypothetical protein